MNWISDGLLAPIGRGFLGFLAVVGRVSSFMGNAIFNAVTPPYFGRNILVQLMRIGYFSLPVVGLTALFTGMVLALQSSVGFSRMGAESAIATVVVLSITRELGPVMAGLMVAGRVGAAIAAEIGTMRVTEQIDAMVTLSTNPFKYLVAPRLIAAILVMPVLVLIADIIGVMGGFSIAAFVLDFNPHTYLRQSFLNLETIDWISGLIKATVFGFIIALMGCYHGYNSGRGAQGVGTATTNAVVSASILILIFNYVLTQLFFS